MAWPLSPHALYIVMPFCWTCVNRPLWDLFRLVKGEKQDHLRGSKSHRANALSRASNQNSWERDIMQWQLSVWLLLFGDKYVTFADISLKTIFDWIGKALSHWAERKSDTALTHDNMLSLSFINLCFWERWLGCIGRCTNTVAFHQLLPVSSTNYV